MDSVINRLAGAKGARGSGHDKELARELAGNRDAAGVAELAANLYNKDRRIASDCIKTLYETGYLAPELIAPHVRAFLSLLDSQSNRMVWGAMTALAQIAPIRAAEIFGSVDAIRRAMENGSVITVDSGVQVLARIAADNEEYNRSVFPDLLRHLGACRPKEVGQHAESVFVAVNIKNRDAFIAVLEKRMDDLTSPQRKRVKKLLDAARKIVLKGGRADGRSGSAAYQRKPMVRIRGANAAFERAHRSSGVAGAL